MVYYAPDPIPCLVLSGAFQSIHQRICRFLHANFICLAPKTNKCFVIIGVLVAMREGM